MLESEDNLKDWFFSFYDLVSRDPTYIVRLGGKKMGANLWDQRLQIFRMVSLRELEARFLSYIQVLEYLIKYGVVRWYPQPIPGNL